MPEENGNAAAAHEFVREMCPRLSTADRVVLCSYDGRYGAARCKWWRSPPPAQAAAIECATGGPAGDCCMVQMQSALSIIASIMFAQHSAVEHMRESNIVTPRGLA